MEASRPAQAELGRVGRQIAKDMPGVEEFVNPGVKDNRESIDKKMVKYDGQVERFTDLARATFIVDKPERAGPIAAALGRHFGVVEENWRATNVGYTDKTMNLRFANGLIGEVQLMNRAMSDAKSVGHKFYKQASKLDPVRDRAQRQAAMQQQVEIYGRAIKSFSPEWRDATRATLAKQGFKV